jgi:putative RNA 2'-phosphotransferase
MAGKNIRKVDTLSRLMHYVLGTGPDEFGLVPDQEGFIPIKDLLKVIHEEPHMGYVRESHLMEVILHDRDKIFEVAERKIRSRKRSFPSLNTQEVFPNPPKLLFKGVKRKTYPAVLTNGLLPGARDHVVMTTDRDLAIRIAHRLDQHPVILEIRAQAASDSGTPFFPFGDSLYVADQVPVRFINGPPLPTHPSEEREPVKRNAEPTPGSFILDGDRDPDLSRRDRAKKKKGWKQEVRRARKGKHARWAR